MKILFIFLSAFAFASAFNSHNVKIQQQEDEVAVAEPKGYNHSIPAAVKPNGIHNNSVQADVDNEGRITYGLYARDGQFPYQVGLYLRLGYYKSFCGGSLIGRDWVLTAAHCMKGITSITVYLGSTIRNRGEQFYTVGRRNIIIHHNWNERNARNDIALIRIPTISYSSNIQPIRLPSMSSNNLYAGNNALVSGWGYYSDNSGLSNYLLWGQTTIVTNEFCRKNFGRYGNSITENIICMSSNNRINSCYGDSGGPLVVQDSNILVGVSSLLPDKSCVRYFLAGFTRVSNYLDWIKQHTGIYY